MRVGGEGIRASAVMDGAREEALKPRALFFFYEYHVFSANRPTVRSLSNTLSIHFFLHIREARHRTFPTSPRTHDEWGIDLSPNVVNPTQCSPVPLIVVLSYCQCTSSASPAKSIQRKQLLLQRDAAADLGQVCQHHFESLAVFMVVVPSALPGVDGDGRSHHSFSHTKGEGFQVVLNNDE